MNEKNIHLPGVFINGGITINGPMFDIHDNHNVYIGGACPHRADGEMSDVRGKMEESACPQPTDDFQTNDNPEVLSTKVALRYWERLQNKGFVDEHFRLMEGVSRKQAMYIADLFAEHIGLTSRWKHFQELWQMKNLAQEKWDMQQTGNIPPRAKEIEEVFKD